MEDPAQWDAARRIARTRKNEVETMPLAPHKGVAGPHAEPGWREAQSRPDDVRLRELDAQHRSLSAVFTALVARVQQIAEHENRDDADSELLRLIAEVEQFLPAHFAFEEAGGYLSDALAIAPRLSKRAALLQRDHRKFTARFAMLAALARDPKKTIASWELIVIAIREFTEELRQHEQDEDRLIQEAFIDDLVGG